MSGMTHIVFFNIAATGHMNPTLPLVKELCARGAKVTYFVEESMRTFVESAGASWRNLQNSDFKDFPQDIREACGVAEDADPDTFAFPKNILAMAAHSLPSLLTELKALNPSPSAIVYDPFLPQGPVAAHVLHIPYISMLTMPGPGVLDRPTPVIEAWEGSPLVQMARKSIKEMYAFDVLEQSLLMEMYSPHENIVTTIEEVFAPCCTEMQVQRFGHFAHWKCVGTLMDLSVKRISNAKCTNAAGELPWEFIDEAVKSGKRLLYVSLGTVANSFFYDQKFGEMGRTNGLADLTGKQFLQYVFGKVFEVIGKEKDVLVLMSVGPNADVLQGLPEAPENFILRESVQQLEVLSKCHGFICHGGANSMHEALGLGVPMAVVPVFGDQPTNAASIAKTGAGFSFCQPLDTFTAEALKDAVTAILDPDERNSYRAAAAAIMQRTKEAGGVQAAADAVWEVVRARAGKFGGA